MFIKILIKSSLYSPGSLIIKEDKGRRTFTLRLSISFVSSLAIWGGSPGSWRRRGPAGPGVVTTRAEVRPVRSPGRGPGTRGRGLDERQP